MFRFPFFGKTGCLTGSTGLLTTASQSLRTSFSVASIRSFSIARRNINAYDKNLKIPKRNSIKILHAPVDKETYKDKFKKQRKMKDLSE